MINGKVRRFCRKNKSILLNKTVGLFTCGLSEDHEALKALEKGIGKELIEHSKAISHFGGELRMYRLNFIFRFFVKKVMGSKGGKPSNFRVNKDSIKEFAEKINK